MGCERADAGQRRPATSPGGHRRDDAGEEDDALKKKGQKFRKGSGGWQTRPK